MSDLPDPLEDGPPAVPEEEALAGPDAGRRIERVVAEVFGEDSASHFARLWEAQREWQTRHLPDEGLRERKKRETRQRISDIATVLFVRRGFDTVKVSEIAELAGVSEKTIYNYFPTKEALVFDQADSQMEALASALRRRDRGVSPTHAIVQELKKESERFGDAIADARLDFLPAFGEMIRSTPSLRAAWAEHRNHLVDAITEILASEAGVDPGEPEPTVAARALVSLVELLYEATLRHIRPGVPAAEVQEAIDLDLERAARLLDTGLWSLHLMLEGRRSKQQFKDAAIAAEQARKQVMAALRDARAAWRALRDEQREFRSAQAATMRGRETGTRERQEAIRRNERAMREPADGIRAEARAMREEARGARRPRA